MPPLPQGSHNSTWNTIDIDWNGEVEVQYQASCGPHHPRTLEDCRVLFTVPFFKSGKKDSRRTKTTDNRWGGQDGNPGSRSPEPLFAGPSGRQPRLPNTDRKPLQSGLVCYVFSLVRLVAPAQEQNNTCPWRVSGHAPGLNSQAAVPTASPHREPRALRRHGKRQDGLEGPAKARNAA
ncbi:hypothetical protein H920_07108 [Fukomys damarensis]|uniref:Uncharacterized protein n=1 Tax=Fukomys damarensis TaxID=885580 RepID=A0A091E8H3_FUKDA|nr:hypothetical protein H920_07108 [Fukomys damarensis]